MKKINLFLLSVVVTSALFLGGCKKDETSDASISFAGDAGYTATDASVDAGSTIKIKWTATSTMDMKYITISEGNAAVVGWNNVEIPSASSTTYIAEASITVPSSGGPYTYSVIVYDKDKVELARKSVVITITTPVALTPYSGRVLGDQNNTPVGSLFASSTGLVYKSADVNTTIGPKIDITYGLLGSSNVPSVISGSERVANGFTQPSGNNNPSITKYMATALDITTVTNTQLNALDFSNATTTITVAAGNTYAFKNAAGKIGLFKVTSLSTAATTGSITIDVKVQP